MSKAESVESIVDEEDAEDEGETEEEAEEQMETQDEETSGSDGNKSALAAERSESRAYGSITHKCEVRDSSALKSLLSLSCRHTHTHSQYNGNLILSGLWEEVYTHRQL